MVTLQLSKNRTYGILDTKYFYEAAYISNYDGDTIDFNVKRESDFGFGIKTVSYYDITVRSCGINACEMRGGTAESKAKGIASRDYVAKQLFRAKKIYLQTFKDKRDRRDKGKYGRYLAVIWYIPRGGKYFRNLNEELVTKGYAKEASY